jgi:AraC family transcriptional regulator
MESPRDKIAPSIPGVVPNRSGTAADRPTYPAAVRRATKFIDANLGQRMGLPKIAAAAGLSPFHFGRLFKQTTGLSPHQYLLERRISAAKEMLRTQRFSAAEIAAELGFYDQSHFSQVFKRNVGMTPRQFTEKF